MKIYYAIITDHQGNSVLDLDFAATNRQAAAMATEYIKWVPPACGFKIGIKYVDAKEIAKLLNMRGLARVIKHFITYSNHKNIYHVKRNC